MGDLGTPQRRRFLCADFYDGNFKRVKNTVGGSPIYTVYDASGSLVHIDDLGAGNETDYVSGAGVGLARIGNNAVTYLHNDHLGSAASGTNSSRAVLWTQHYTPFGEQWNAVAANDDQAGFTGHIRDSATGLNYMQARSYDPTIGRFLSIDPVTFMETGNPGMFNRYTYSFNNPTNQVDQDGRESHSFLEAMFLSGPEPRKESRTNTLARQIVDVSSETITVGADKLPSKNEVRVGADRVSNTMTIVAVAAAVASQPQIAGPAAIAAAVAGYVEAGLSEEPGTALIVEGAANLTGTKSVGTAARIAKGVMGEAKHADNVIDGMDEAGQAIVSDTMKEEYEQDQIT